MIRCSSANCLRSTYFTEFDECKRSYSQILNIPNQSNLSNVFHKSHRNSSNIVGKSKFNIDFTQCATYEVKNIKIIPNIFVSVIITNKTSILVAIPIDISINDLCLRLASYFGIDSEKFDLLFSDGLGIIEPNTTFAELNIAPGSMLKVILNVRNMDIIVISKLIEKVKLDPNPITVKSLIVHSKNMENGVINTVHVQFEKVNFTKHFLGGFRHKTTGLEYHNAVTQTRPVPKKMSTMEMFSRDTQTHKIRNQTVDNVVTTSTQMTKTGYYVSNVTDRVVTPGSYQTADELQALLEAKVVIMQKYSRRWLAKRRVQKLREIRQLIIDYQLSEKARKANDISKRLQELFDKRRCPLYNDDFDLLYHAIEMWRQREHAKIDPTLPTSVRKALACKIMDDQHEWIVAVDRLKNNAIKLLNFRAKKNKLVKVSKPVRWKDRYGEEIEMELISTSRGKEVFEIYKSLSMDFFNAEERLDILLTLKRLITNRPERICSDLLGLINREADLIMRNVGMHLLKGLRTRINTSFLILCRLPSFNPGVEKYSRVPKDPLELNGTFQLCRYCNNYLKNTQFMFSVKSKRLGACRTCTRLYNHAMPRQELSPYRHALNLIQKAEVEYQDYSKMAFIFSEIDIKHLITKIWDSKSVLSSDSDLENLIFIRWNASTEWSPWNTALMTHDEAEAHHKLDDPCTAYCDKLLDKIHQKQIAGHNYFMQLNELSQHFVVHNLEEERAAIEVEKEAGKNMFLAEKAVRFE